MSPVGGKMTEGELLAAITRCAREHGWRDYHPWSSLHSAKGWPDLFLAKRIEPDRLWLVVWELKNATAKPTPDQVWWLDFWAEFGERASQGPGVFVHVSLVRPQDLEAAYWLLMGQWPKDDHQWPAPWPLVAMRAA